MGKVQTGNRYFKYVVIALVIVFLITAALLLLEFWEKNQEKFPILNPADESVDYQGQEYVLKDNTEAFLVLGLDKFDGASTADSYNNDKQADFLMLFVFDNDAKTCSAIHINRDTMANVNILAVDEFKVVDTVKKQIALAHTYGKGKEASCRNTKESVEDLLLGIKVDHYISFTMDSVVVMNDLVGGVEVTVLDDFSGIDEALVKGQQVTLKGQQALHYVRTRYGLEDSSNSTRMERQQQYINALYDKTISCINADDQFIIRLVDTMDDYVVYDSSNHKLQNLANKFNEYEFLGIRDIEGESKLADEHIEFYPNQDSIMKNVIDLFYKPKD